MESLDSLHPAVAAWFRRSFDAPTEAQSRAWPAIQARRHVLVAAPTGSGKTLAAFLAAIDELVREGQHQRLPDETRIVYVSPLKALSNDIERNLQGPIDGIRRELFESGLPDVEIRAWVRTGDTPQQERAQMRRRPPHILVTTPESLYILLGSQSGRDMLATTRTVIVDEIHALAGNKRGAHLALSLARLQALTAQRSGGLLHGMTAGLTRIGLSATQKPIEAVARFLTDAPCTIIDGGHVRRRDLQLELPPVPLDTVMSGETWTLVYDRLAQLVMEHRTTLVFVNTRRLAERLARQLSERLGAEQVMAHHGSMARERRWQAEQRLKRGELKVLVATASLELGIDIGDVDLVCQIASPRSINAFLQRVGRSGHAVGGTPKGRLFPLSRDDLVECAALLDAVRRGELDLLRVPPGTLDVLSQHLVAEVASQEWDEEDLYRLVRAAQPYAQLPRADFDAVVRMLAEGFSTRRGRQQGALLHHDGIHHRLRPRRGARLTALTSGGAIPDTADYQVMLEPEAHIVGSVNEDFAVESMAGDVFQLGNTSYRILRVERGTVRVQDAQGVPPTIPFWLGEAPGRTDELSDAVSRLRQQLARCLENPGERQSGVEAAQQWLMREVGLTESAAAQLTTYLAAALAALGCLPARDTVVLERFFDEAGGMQLVVHAPFGSRVNRAWGLSLRKRFCRQFNFELQAAATEDALVLSLTTAHSFELMEVSRYLHPDSALHLLEQALFAAPMFTTRWRWVASISLALPRFRGGKKVPPPLARMNAEDLLAGVFPDQVACAENLPGEIEVPEHPLVRQCIADCLHEAMDSERFLATLAGIDSGAIRVVARDLTEPSPLALEVLSARPYAFLDDAPLEERRTQAVMSRRFLDPQSAADIGRLDPAAIARVREEAWPAAATADELHDALMWLGFLTQAEVDANAAWPALLAELTSQGRVARRAQPALWIATERRDWWDSEAGLASIIRGRLDGAGPVTARRLARDSGLPPARIEAALAALQAQGIAMSGRFTPEAAAADVTEWCERGLLARIHRYTVKTLRAQIEPVAARDFLRFLCDWQRVSAAARMQGPEALAAVLDQLEGCEVAAGAWESEVLPARIAEYDPAWLDEHGLAGRYVWARQSIPARAAGAAGPVRSTPITLLPRRQLRLWSALTQAPALADTPASAAARAVAELLADSGASFYDDLVQGTGLLPTQVEAALGELAALGLVNADGFGGLRALLLPADRRRPSRGRRRALFGMADSGRWALVHRQQPAAREEAVEHVVRTLLKRWGVIFWRLMAAEADWLPPWRELMTCCRRLEARGEIRGGRFVAGFSGEQYALPEAVALLRETRQRAEGARWVSLSAADPLNLIGILTPGPRLPALAGNRLLYRDGLPVATLAAGEVRFLTDLDEPARWQAQNLLIRGSSTLAPDAVTAPVA